MCMTRNSVIFYALTFYVQLFWWHRLNIIEIKAKLSLLFLRTNLPLMQLESFSLLGYWNLVLWLRMITYLVSCIHCFTWTLLLVGLRFTIWCLPLKHMGERKEEDLYRNFSRKDLQGLCKKYGLPAKKSNSEMATSLILYLEVFCWCYYHLLAMRKKPVYILKESCLIVKFSILAIGFRFFQFSSL